MNQAERQILGRHLVYMAKLYGKQVDQQMISMMLDDLMDLPFEKLQNACSEYRRDSKNRFFPLPAQLRDLVNPTISNQDKARVIAGKITEAVSKFGWCNGQKAREHIGEEGWKVVERNGGWSYLCENLGTEINPSTFMAQARDAIQSELTMIKAGVDTSKPGLNQGNAPNQIGSLVKELSVKKSMEEK